MISMNFSKTIFIVNYFSRLHSCGFTLFCFFACVVSVGFEMQRKVRAENVSKKIIKGELSRVIFIIVYTYLVRSCVNVLDRGLVYELICAK
jgi:hypothetical protein